MTARSVGSALDLSSLVVCSEFSGGGGVLDDEEGEGADESDVEASELSFELEDEDDASELELELSDVSE